MYFDDFGEFELGTDTKKRFTLPEQEEKKEVRVLTELEYAKLFANNFVKFISWKTLAEKGMNTDADPDFLSLYLYSYLNGRYGYKRELLEKYSIQYPIIARKISEIGNSSAKQSFAMDFKTYQSLKGFYKEQYNSWKKDYEAGKDENTELNYIMMFIFELLNNSDDVKSIHKKIDELGERYRDRFAGLDAFLKRYSVAEEETPQRNNNIADSSWTRINNAYNIKSFDELTERFIEDCKRYATLESEYAPYARLNIYMSGFGSLSDAQFDYYIYLRTMLRRHIKTEIKDFSYIELYISEIINNVWIDAKGGLDELMYIYDEYSDAFRYKKSEFLFLILDYIEYYKLEVDIADLLSANRDNFSGNQYLLDLRMRMRPSAVDYSVIFNCSDYDMFSNKFANEHQKEVYEYIPKALSAVFAYMEKTNEKSIEEIFNITKRRNRHVPFRGYIFAGERSQNNKFIFDYVTNYGFRSFVTNFVRAAENELRGHLGARSKLRNVEIGPEYQKFIKAYFNKAFMKTEEKPEINIEIDRTKLNNAVNDADITVKILETENGDAESKAFNEAENNVIEFMRNNGGSCAEDELFKYDANYILIIDSINEKNLYNEDKLLITEYNGIYKLDAEIEAEVRQEQTEVIKEEAISDAEEQSFSESERQYIKAVLENDFDKMQRIAEESGGFTELIEEQINEKYLGIYGDILIENGEIIEDYVESAKELTEDIK